MERLFNEETSNPTLNTYLRDGIFTQSVSVDCVHTCETYSVEVGHTNDCTKHERTYFRLNLLDDGITGERKELECIMQGKAEREILIGLLETAISALKDEELELVLTTRK